MSVLSQTILKDISSALSLRTGWMMPGIDKAYWNIDQIPAAPVIRVSFGVASLTDAGVGSSTMNQTAVFASDWDQVSTGSSRKTSHHSAVNCFMSSFASWSVYGTVGYVDADYQYARMSGRLA